MGSASGAHLQRLPYPVCSQKPTQNVCQLFEVIHLSCLSHSLVMLLQYIFCYLGLQYVLILLVAVGIM